VGTGGPIKVISTERGKFPTLQADEYTKFLAGDIWLQNVMGEVVRNFIKKKSPSVA
jgi:hypothetical protein